MLRFVSIQPFCVLQVAEVFETAEKMGLKVVRIWAFSDGDTWNALQPSIGHLDERVLR